MLTVRRLTLCGQKQPKTTKCVTIYLSPNYTVTVKIASSTINTPSLTPICSITHQPTCPGSDRPILLAVHDMVLFRRPLMSSEPLACTQDQIKSRSALQQSHHCQFLAKYQLVWTCSPPCSRAITAATPHTGASPPFLNLYLATVRATPGAPKHRLAKSVLHDQNEGNSASHVFRAFTLIGIGGNPERTDWGSVPAVYEYIYTTIQA